MWLELLYMALPNGVKPCNQIVLELKTLYDTKYNSTDIKAINGLFIIIPPFSHSGHNNTNKENKQRINSTY